MLARRVSTRADNASGTVDEYAGTSSQYQSRQRSVCWALGSLSSDSPLGAGLLDLT
jgi:hypothetical protein